MSQTNRQDRERAVQAMTNRSHLHRRMKHTLQELTVVEDDAEREALRQSLAADIAALEEEVKRISEIKASMRGAEERIRRKTQEALRCQEKWRQSQSWSNGPLPFFPAGRVPPGDSRTLGLFMAACVIVAIVFGVLLLKQ